MSKLVIAARSVEPEYVVGDRVVIRIDGNKGWLSGEIASIAEDHYSVRTFETLDAFLKPFPSLLYRIPRPAHAEMFKGTLK